MKHNKWFHRLKYIVTGFALLNLIFLFVFHYELPSFIKHKINEQKNHSYSDEQIENPNRLTISFEPEELTYRGKGDLNLTKGVSISRNNESNIKASLFSEIQPGEKRNRKIVTYIAEDSYGNTGTANRTLVLKGYKKPSITLSEDYPSIDDTELDMVASIFKDSGCIKALDGYGNDITGSIDATYTIMNMEGTEIRISFFATNMFGDTATYDLDMELDRTKPLIVLTKEEEHLSIGSPFSAVSYIASATDKNGYDISTAVITEGVVDTYTAGTYRLTYKLVDAEGIEAEPVSLKVTVN